MRRHGSLHTPNRAVTSCRRALEQSRASGAGEKITPVTDTHVDPGAGSLQAGGVVEAEVFRSLTGLFGE